jgi:hypothetical protein
MANVNNFDLLSEQAWWTQYFSEYTTTRQQVLHNRKLYNKCFYQILGKFHNKEIY